MRKVFITDMGKMDSYDKVFPPKKIFSVYILVAYNLFAYFAPGLKWRGSTHALVGRVKKPENDCMTLLFTEQQYQTI